MQIERRIASPRRGSAIRAVEEKRAKSAAKPPIRLILHERDRLLTTGADYNLLSVARAKLCSLVELTVRAVLRAATALPRSIRTSTSYQSVGKPIPTARLREAVAVVQAEILGVAAVRYALRGVARCPVRVCLGCGGPVAALSAGE